MAYIADCPKPVEQQLARGGRSTEGTAAPATSRLATELHFGEGASVGKVTMSAEVLLSFETTIAAPDGGRDRGCCRELRSAAWSEHRNLRLGERMNRRDRLCEPVHSGNDCTAHRRHGGYKSLNLPRSLSCNDLAEL